jgi:hypothetical protein
MENQGVNISKGNNFGKWSVYCFMIQEYQIQVIHSDKKNIMIITNLKIKWNNRHEIKHIYLNWKKKSEAKIAQCSSSLQPTVYIFVSRQNIPIHQSGNLSKTIWNCSQCVFPVPTTSTLRTESAVFWMHFWNMRQDSIVRKYPWSLPHLRCLHSSIYFLFGFFFCKSLSRNVTHSSLFLGPVFSIWTKPTIFNFFSKHSWRDYVKMAVVFFFLFTFWLLCPGLWWCRKSSGLEGFITFLSR